MKPKLIALDLDETTLNTEGCLSPANRTAIYQAITRGIQIVVATGRPISTVPEEIKNFSGIRYVIAGNGAAIYDLSENKAILRKTLLEEAVRKILELTADEALTYEAFINGVAYAQKDYVQNPTIYMDGERHTDYVQATRHPVENIRTFILEHQAELDSLDLVVQDFDTKKRMAKELGTLKNIYITTSTPPLLEISHKDCGKHRGLQFLTELLGINRNETVAFGNADNDAEMLQWAEVGVAVKNASSRCLVAADYITDESWNDGVAHAFQKLLYIY